MAAVALLLTGCAAKRAGESFRARLPQLVGQPVQAVVDDIGPGSASGEGANTRRQWEYTTIGAPPYRSCDIQIVADADDRIIETQLRGTDYDCGLLLRDLRKDEARYRADPGLREREAREMQDRLNRLVDLRRSAKEDEAD